jgi:hypothetical protein
VFEVLGLITTGKEEEKEVVGGSLTLVQAGPELLGQSNPPASASPVAGTLGMYHHSQLCLGFLNASFLF